MKKTLVLLLSLLCLAPARAEWKLIDLSDDAAYYVDDFFEPGPKATIWELVEYRKPNQFGSKSVKVLWEVDCVHSVLRTLSFSSHPYRMGMGEPITVENRPGEWENPAEASQQESIYIVACGIEPVIGPKT